MYSSWEDQPNTPVAPHTCESSAEGVTPELRMCARRWIREEVVFNVVLYIGPAEAHADIRTLKFLLRLWRPHMMRVLRTPHRGPS